MGLAATVLYMSGIKTGENISQKEISNAAGVTEVTLRNRYKKQQIVTSHVQYLRAGYLFFA